MKPRTPSVLVDTHAIVECRRTGSWKAFSRRYRLETVVHCVRRICRGRRAHHAQQQMDRARLVASLNAVHEPTERELAELALRTSGIHLAEDEVALWAHTLGRDDDWAICSSDAAGLRCGARVGFRDQLTSLERLFQQGDVQPRKPLRRQHTEQSQRRTLSKLVVVDATVLRKSA